MGKPVSQQPDKRRGEPAHNERSARPADLVHAFAFVVGARVLLLHFRGELRAALALALVARARQARHLITVINAMRAACSTGQQTWWRMYIITAIDTTIVH